MSMKRENGRVVIDISDADYKMLLIALGMAMAVSLGDDERVALIVRLANTINEGNPDWTPYALSSPAPAS
jgi:hypothetical protein